MTKFIVTFEIRTKGAIGKFDHYATSVVAADKDEALAKGGVYIRSLGYETRFPVSVEAI